MTGSTKILYLTAASFSSLMPPRISASFRRLPCFISITVPQAHLLLQSSNFRLCNLSLLFLPFSSPFAIKKEAFKHLVSSRNGMRTAFSVQVFVKARVAVVENFGLASLYIRVEPTLLQPTVLGFQPFDV